MNFGFFPLILFLFFCTLLGGGFFLLLSIYCVATVINQCGLTGNFLIRWGPLLDLPFYYRLFLTKRKSSIKQSLATAVTAKLFVKSIADMSNPGRFGALSVGPVPTPPPLRVDEGGFSRCYPVFLPSVAFAFVFARLPPLVELLAAWSWTVALIVVIA
jgi:hypothetical protein